MLFAPIKDDGELLGGEAIRVIAARAGVAVDMPFRFVAEIDIAGIDKVAVGIVGRRVYAEVFLADDFGLACVIRKTWVWE